MIVIATDAPLGSRNIERMAGRAPLGIGRTGGYMSNGSGDFVIAFSTAGVGADAATPRARLANRDTSPLFLATVEATEEAIYNALVAAATMTGFGGRTVASLPLERLRELVEARAAAAKP
jgi:D-aminopeptidase